MAQILNRTLNKGVRNDRRKTKAKESNNLGDCGCPSLGRGYFIFSVAFWLITLMFLPTKAIASEYFNIHPQEGVNVEKLAKKLDRLDLDLIYRRAATLLGARPQLEGKIDILVFKNVEQFQAHPDVKKLEAHQAHAFYVHTYQKIYIPRQHIREGVFVHEFGHIILDYTITGLLNYETKEEICRSLENRYMAEYVHRSL